MEVNEVHFWRTQAEDGRIMGALREHRERAVRFFGVAAVESEDEAEIYRTLEAHELLVLSEKEILSILNRVTDSMDEDLNKFAPDVQIEIKKLPRFSSEHAAAAKRAADEHLKRVFSK
jgi:hypothetical protein